MLDTFELCSEELQQKLIPMRKKFKEHEDRIVEEGSKVNNAATPLLVPVLGH